MYVCVYACVGLTPSHLGCRDHAQAMCEVWVRHTILHSTTSRVMFCRSYIRAHAHLVPVPLTRIMSRLQVITKQQ